jgi:bifunctional non-homologous end joining protein LigD
MFGESNITKGQLAAYYGEVASWMLPHIKDRPIVMQRFPDGIDRAGFYHKDIPDYFPEWIERVTVEKEGGTVSHVLCQDRSTLVYLANQGCITPHTWLSRRDKLNYPDQLIFDLDPSGSFEQVRRAAQALRELLTGLGLAPHVKTSGASGLHVICMIARRSNFDDVRHFARTVSEILVSADPGNFTIEHRKANRGKRVYIDTARNAYAQTAAPAYAVRALSGAPVSTPIEWEELEDTKLNAQSFNIESVLKRLNTIGDSWNGIRQTAKPLGPALRRLSSHTEAA